jgi:uncharacterized damage-inducible protein DinB
MKPDISTLPEHFQNYVNQVEEDDIIKAYEKHSSSNIQFFAGISEQKSTFSYALGKWTVKEVLQHVIDTERVFCYRALAIARGEKNLLPGFDENIYASNSHANERSWSEIVEEYRTVCSATRCLIKSFSKEDYVKTGIASNHPISVLAMLFTIVGHAAHHVKILKERYLM